MNEVRRLLPFSLLFAAVIALWLRFDPLSSPDTACAIELSISSPVSGEAWLRFNVGNGWNIQDTRALWLTESAAPRTYRIALPAGNFKSFRLLPPDPEKPAVLAAARIIDGDGAVAATIAGANYSPFLKTIPFSLTQPLRVSEPGERTWMATVMEFALMAAVLSLLTALFAPRLHSLAPCAGRLAGWARSHPHGTLFAIAVLAVVVSCHPVIFAGRSFVSPNNGTLCLYDVQPTLPGTSGRVEEWTRSDVNATPWAHLPYSMITHDAVLHDGALPLWNRFTMCGLSLLGQGQSMPGDPLFWVPVFANGAAWAWDVRFLAAKTLFAFGIGLLVLAVGRRLPVAAALAFSAAFIGFFSYRFNHPAFFSLSYAPWILLCWLRAAAAPDLRHTARWALALIAADWLLLNSGTAKEASMLLLMLNAAGLLAVFLAAERLRWKKTGLMVAGSLIFLALSAPLWVVFLDTLGKGCSIYDAAATHQITPGLALGLFDDLFYRQLVLDEWHVNPALNFFALAGVLWALADWQRVRASRFAFAFAITALPALAMVFGVIPVALIDRVPLLRNISHIDNTFTCVLIVLLFPLAGAGWAAAVDGTRSWEEWKVVWRRSLALLSLLVFLYLGTALAVPALDEFSLRTTRPTLFSQFFRSYAVALLIAVAIVPWFARRVVNRHGLAALNWLVLFVAFAALHFRHGMWLETKFDFYVMNPQPRVVLQARSPAIDAIRVNLAEPGRVVGFGRILQPGFNAVLGLESIAGADAVGNAALMEWFSATGLGARWLWSPVVTKDNLTASRPFLDALNVRYYLGASANHGEVAPGLQPRGTADLDVYESPTAWPRAFFTDRLGHYDSLPALAEAVRTGDGRPFAAVAATHNTSPDFPSDQHSRQVVPARDYRLESNRTSFTIEAPRAGVAVLNESFLPDDFRATVNGAPAQVLRVNHVFKGVMLPAAGTYQVSFEYWPHLLTPALRVAAGAAVAILAAAGFLFLPARRRRVGLAPEEFASPVNSDSPPAAAVGSAAP